MEEGRPLRQVLGHFHELISEAGVLVAHNISFDEKIVGSELLRAGMTNPITGKEQICTMLRSADYVGIPGNYGGPKWPKLTELHQKLFNTGFDEAHNASVDINATAKCFWELRRIGLI
jgi:DNA polymerase III epsilon subunit-like protein